MPNSKCECSLSQAVVGKGCQWCSPSHADWFERGAGEADISSGRLCRDCGAINLADAKLLCLSTAVVSCDGDDIFF